MGRGSDSGRRDLLHDRHKRFWSRLRCLPLFWIIVLWVVLALIVFTVLGWIWGKGALWSARLLTNWRSAGVDATPLDIVKVSLTTIGGIGGTGYLVIKYRERASAERAEAAAERAQVDAKQQQAEQRLLSAVQQLGSESPQVRIAGVYSLADVADTYRGPYKQRVVNILCGYLRVERGHWEYRKAPCLQTDDTKVESQPQYVTKDGPVESTILGELARRLRKARSDSRADTQIKQEVGDGQLWCDCEIDLHGTHLTERVNPNGATCRLFSAYNAQFDNLLTMKSSTFTVSASFYGAAFSGEAYFSGSTFRDFSNFNEATFKKYASFKGVSFRGDAGFRNIRFDKGVYFGGARFNINYWHTDPPIFLGSMQSDPSLNLPSGAGWADFSEENPLNIDDPESWHRVKYI